MAIIAKTGVVARAEPMVVRAVATITSAKNGKQIKSAVGSLFVSASAPRFQQRLHKVDIRLYARYIVLLCIHVFFALRISMVATALTMLGLALATTPVLALVVGLCSSVGSLFMISVRATFCTAVSPKQQVRYQCQIQ